MGGESWPLLMECASTDAEVKASPSAFVSSVGSAAGAAANKQDGVPVLPVSLLNFGLIIRPIGIAEGSV